MNKTCLKSTLLASFVSVSLLSGCASIVSDSSYPVAISSTPPEAYFVVKNRSGVEVHSGTTPATVSLKSGNGYFSSASYTVTLKKEGYEDKSFVIESSMDGWYIGNILIGGIIGFLIVDPATGAMWKLPEAQSAQMMPNQVATKELQIMRLDDLDPANREQLIRVQ